MGTYRERRERRAEQLREWGERRVVDGDAKRESAKAMVAMIPFGQPVHGQADRRRREKSFEAFGRGIEHGAKGEEMVGRADGIEGQLATSIYDDDPDAIVRLEEKLARLEGERERMKQARAQARKELREQLKGKTAYEREQLMPFAQYEIANRGGLITSTRQRIERLKREKVQGPRDRLIAARFASSCEECGAELVKGALIRYNRQQGARCYPGCQNGGA